MPFWAHMAGWTQRPRSGLTYTIRLHGVSATCVQMSTKPCKGGNEEILENSKQIDLKWNGNLEEMECPVEKWKNTI